MLRVLTGRSGCGKSAQVFEEIAKLADVGETGILLLVPEQYAFNAERELCAKAGNSISLLCPGPCGSGVTGGTANLRTWSPVKPVTVGGALTLGGGGIGFVVVSFSDG